LEVFGFGEEGDRPGRYESEDNAVYKGSVVSGQYDGPFLGHVLTPLRDWSEYQLRNRDDAALEKLRDRDISHLCPSAVLAYPFHNERSFVLYIMWE